VRPESLCSRSWTEERHDADFEETVASALAAQHRPRELVIVVADDGDQSMLANCSALAALEPSEFRCTTAAGDDIAAARQAGIAATGGEFVAVIEPGARVAPEFFDRALYVLQRYANIGYVTAWVRRRGADGVGTVDRQWHTDLPCLLGDAVSVPGGVGVIRRAAWLAAGSAPELAADTPAVTEAQHWLGLLAAGYVGVCLPEPLIETCSENRIASSDNERLLAGEQLTHRIPEIYRAYGAELFNLQNANGPARFWTDPAGPPPLAEDEERSAVQAAIRAAQETNAALAEQDRAAEAGVQAQEAALEQVRRENDAREAVNQQLQADCRAPEVRIAAQQREIVALRERAADLPRLLAEAEAQARAEEHALQSRLAQRRRALDRGRTSRLWSAWLNRWRRNP